MRALYFDKVDSTNEVMKRMISEETSPFLFIIAREQIQGKGRLNRKWFSEKDKSLTVSVLLPYEENPFQIGFVAAYSALKLLESLYPIELMIKWPNDIFFQDKKIGGILSEFYSHRIILGIGLNLNQTNFHNEIQQIATSIFRILNKELPVKEFFKSFQEYFLKYYREWKDNNIFFIKKYIRPKLLWVGKGIMIDFNKNIRKIEGVFKGIDDRGFLIIENNEGIRTITSGDLKIWLQE